MKIRAQFIKYNTMPRPKKQKATTEESTQQVTPDNKVPKRQARFATGGGGFDLLKIAKERKDALQGKADRVIGFKSMADVQSSFLPVPWLAFRWLTGCCGIPINTISEFIGEENVGKSSLVMSLLGNFAKNNIPALYVNTEAKELESVWTRRLMARDPELASILLNAIETPKDISTGEHVTRTFTMNEMDKQIRQWVYECRVERGIPVSIPLVAVIDSTSRLLNPAQAEVAMAEDKKGGAKAILNGVEDVGGQIGIGAKWFHAWANMINPLMSKQNVTILCVSAQNANLSAGASGLAADGGKSLNKTKAHGLALNQACGLQITVTNAGMLRKGTDVVGRNIKMRCLKNSYGPIYRQIVYGLKCERLDDSPGYLDDPIDMAEPLGKLLAEKKLFGTTVSNKRYTSEELGVHQMTAEALQQHILQNPDLEDKVCAALQIHGYDLVEENAPAEDTSESST